MIKGPVMKTRYIAVGIIVLILGWFTWSSASQQAFVTFRDTNIACLGHKHEQSPVKVYPRLSVTVDGKKEKIPAGIGVTGPCVAEIHTHDESGVINIETTTQERLDSLHFIDFFDVWGRSIRREGFDLEVFYDRNIVANILFIPLENQGRIELIYTSK